MTKLELSKIEMLPKSVENALFEQRETGRVHTPYQAEIRFYSCIGQGDCERLESEMKSFFGSGFVIGRMSDNDLRQMQYWAVSCITLATRYAIQGGLGELDAFNFSDSCIRLIDASTSPDAIAELMPKKALELTAAVGNARHSLMYSPHVRACISYINKNLHGKLTVQGIAEECKVSSDYLSSLFKKETGQNISKYILQRKLYAAKGMLDDGMKCGEISYYLSFCSQSHFIACFKKEFGITPQKYLGKAGEH